MSRKGKGWKRWLKRIGAVLLLFFIICYLFFRFGMNMAKSRDELAEIFAKDSQQPVHLQAEVAGYAVHYTSIGNTDGPLIIFSHGSPGSWDGWLRYFQDEELRSRAQLIAYDRPGFNETRPRQPAVSLATQAEVLSPVLDTLPAHRPVIAVGHSYGGPVVVELACRFPDRIDAILILAGSIDPELEEPFFAIQRWLAKPAWHWLLPPDMDVSNREILPLKQELIEQIGCWETLRANVCVLQGSNDMLVPSGNEDYARRMAPENCGTTLMPGVDHFFIWEHTALVKQSLEDLLNLLNQP
ncbi:MAG: alpha/beta hydrolase [Bacteroidia bacterium]